MRYLLVSLLALSLSAQDSWPSWANGWNGRVKITTDNTLVDSANPIPAIYDLSDIGSGDTFWTEVSSTGADIRVGLSGGSTDTEVATHVVEIDTTAKTGFIVFDASKNSTSADVDYYIYAGNSSASLPAEDATYGQEAAYSPSGCVIAYHMDGASVTDIDDATASDIDFTTETNTPLYNVTGKHGKAFECDTGNERIESATFGSSPDLSTSDVTIMGWIYPSDVLGGEIFYNVQYLYSAGASLEKYNDNAKVRANNYQIFGSTAMVTDTWYHIAMFYDSSTLELFLDSGSEGTVSVSGDMSTNESYPSVVGAYPTGSNPYHGRVDSIFVFNTSNASNSSFISTMYNIQDDPNTFWTTAAWEAAPATGGGTKPPAIFYH